MRADRRSALGVLLSAAFVVLVLVLSASAPYASDRSASGTGGVPTARYRPIATSSTTVPPPPATTTTTVDPGLLPQTHDLPSATSPAFESRMLDLWEAIVTDDPQMALPAFFPLNAYMQVKAIADPASDWHSRLIANYDADIHHLHLELGPSAATARLAGVDVPASAAQWIVPGVEYNKGSYYRVYGTRLRYNTGNTSGSFPIYSLISWRGEWYVVHLGPIR